MGLARNAGLKNHQPSRGRATSEEARQLLTESGHGRFRIFAAQIDRWTPFRWSQIPDVISQYQAYSRALGLQCDAAISSKSLAVQPLHGRSPRVRSSSTQCQ